MRGSVWRHYTIKGTVGGATIGARKEATVSMACVAMLRNNANKLLFLEI